MNKKEFINYVEKNKSKLQQTVCDEDLLVDLYETITSYATGAIDGFIEGYDIKLYDIVKTRYQYDEINFVMVLEVKGELVGILNKTIGGYDIEFFYSNQAQPTADYIKSFLIMRDYTYTFQIPDDEDHDILRHNISNHSNIVMCVDGELYMNYMTPMDLCSVNNPTLEDVLPSSKYSRFYVGDNKNPKSVKDMKPIKTIGEFCVDINNQNLKTVDVNVVMEDGTERIVDSRYILYKVIN